MNVAIRQPPKPEKPIKRQPVDNESLPAALEILETPASPTRTASIWFICILCVAMIFWSYFGTFDIVRQHKERSSRPAGSKSSKRSRWAKPDQCRLPTDPTSR
jgi:hypothetical protein